MDRIALLCLIAPYSSTTLLTCIQTFRARLPEVIDQAHHFASIHAAAAASSGSSSGAITSDEATMAFREGLDGTERERESRKGPLVVSETDSGPAVFVLAQESARRTKRWYETSERARRS